MMQLLEPGTVLVANKNTENKAHFVVMPSTMPRFFSALQVSGSNLKDGECFLRGGMTARDVIGEMFDIDHTVEVRILARDGKMRALVLPKEGA